MSDNRTKEQQKADAQDLYIFTNYSTEQIAKFSNVTVRSVQNWAKEGNWADLKAANSLTKPKIVSNLYKRILQLTEEDAIEHAQKISMLATALEKFDKKANASHYINVFMAFNKFLIDSGELQLAQTFNSFQQKFLDIMAKKNKF